MDAELSQALFTAETPRRRGKPEKDKSGGFSGGDASGSGDARERRPARFWLTASMSTGPGGAVRDCMEMGAQRLPGLIGCFL